MARRAGAVIAAALLVGCGLFPDLGEYSGAVPDAGQVSDSATKPDAVTDGAPSVDGGSPCSAPHAFCSDFELPNLLDGWDNARADAPGSVARSTDRSTSASHSLLTTMPRRASNAPNLYASLVKRLTGWNKVAIDFDMFSLTPDWQSNDINSGIVLFYYSSSAIPTGAGMAISMGQGYTTLGTPDLMQVGGDPIPNEAWVHWHIVFDPQGSIDATFGTSHFAAKFPALSTSGSMPTMSIELGIAGYNQPAPLFRIYYDNVTIDYL